ncbi:MAG: DUF5624 domain-containing protein [Crocinitomix sp.]|nr:DUF5624 domain-containing protein [Crocinitomix sp.]
MQTQSTFQKAYTDLFTAYTGPMGKGQGQPGIGTLAANAAATKAGPDSPLLYAYGANLAWFATNQTLQPTSSETISPILSSGFAPGMIELAAVSHLGPAIGSLIRLQENGTEQDNYEVMNSIEKLLTCSKEAKRMNTADAWTEINPIFSTYANDLTTMIEAGLGQVNHYLARVSAGQTPLNFETFRTELLNPSHSKFPSFDSVMIATFALANLANHYQVLTWLDNTITDAASIPKMTVLLSGSAGRATAGLTAKTNPSYLRLMAWAKSKGYSLKSQIYIAPFGPAFSVPSTDKFDWYSLEKTARGIWWQTELAVGLSEPMFKDYPSEKQLDGILGESEITEPSMADFMRRLKYSLGHSTQELASSTSGYILRSLLKNGTQPAGLWIPGLSNNV